MLISAFGTFRSSVALSSSGVSELVLTEASSRELPSPISEHNLDESILVQSFLRGAQRQANAPNAVHSRCRDFPLQRSHNSPKSRFEDRILVLRPEKCDKSRNVSLLPELIHVNNHFHEVAFRYNKVVAFDCDLVPGEVAPGGKWSLFACTMSPGFNAACFTGVTKSELLGKYAGYEEIIDRMGVPDGHETELPADYVNERFKG